MLDPELRAVEDIALVAERDEVDDGEHRPTCTHDAIRPRNPEGRQVEAQDGEAGVEVDGDDVKYVRIVLGPAAGEDAATGRRRVVVRLS